MKKIILTENQYRLLLENRTPPVKEVLGGSFGTFIEKHGDDAAGELQTLIFDTYDNPENLDADDNIISKNIETSPIPFDAIKYYLQQITNGVKTFDELATKFPKELKGGLTFRDTIKQIFLMKAPETSSEDSNDTDETSDDRFNTFANKFILSNCKSMSFCDYQTILSNIVKIIPSDIEFDPKNVKVLEKARQIVIKDGKRGFRDVIYVQLGNGQKTLFYSSSGSNEETTGKKEGEWFIIPGFASNGWFFKTDGTVKLTKGGKDGNQYLTDMAEYLKINGVESLE